MAAGSPRLVSTATTERGRGAGPGPFELAEWKLRFPVSREGTVPRARLVDGLVLSVEPVVSITGPPGYGKSTLLSQWARATATPVATVSLDPGDNDPAVLLAYIAAALDDVERIDVAVCCARMPPGSSVAAVVARRVAAALSSMSAPVTLVLDHAESVRNPRCRDAIAELAAHLPPGRRLGVAARGEPPLPLGTLRSTGEVFELGVRDLAMDAQEARDLVDAAGASIDDQRLADLLQRTEGWPVALYMGALAAGTYPGADPGTDAGADVGSSADRGRDGDDADLLTGADRLVADYLRLELLSRLPDRTVTFLTRTSVLDRLERPPVRRRAAHGRVRCAARIARPVEPAGGPARPAGRVVPVPHAVR